MLDEDLGLAWTSSLFHPPNLFLHSSGACHNSAKDGIKRLAEYELTAVDELRPAAFSICQDRRWNLDSGIGVARNPVTVSKDAPLGDMSGKIPLELNLNSCCRRERVLAMSVSGRIPFLPIAHLNGERLPFRRAFPNGQNPTMVLEVVDEISDL